MSENNTSSTRDWLTVSQAAAKLGKSERTIQRHCKSGKLVARLETTADGVQWLILLEVPPLSPTGADKVTPKGDAVAPPVTRSFHAQNAQETPATRENGGSVPTGYDAGGATGDVTHRVLDPREELVFELRDQVKFLRSALEARDRDAAELRTALRTALAAMPKALPTGESSTQNLANVEAPRRPDTPQSAGTRKVSSDAKIGERGEGLRDLRTILKKVFGVR